MIGTWFACTVASERAAEIITDSELFAPFRAIIGKLAIPKDITRVSGAWYAKCFRRVMVFFYKLITCGWCTSAWTSLFFSLFLPGAYLSLIDCEPVELYAYLVMVPCLFGLANFWHAIFRLVHRGRVFTVDVKHEIVIAESDEPEADDEPEDIEI